MGATIVEDDYDGEFRYDGAPIAALRSAENADVVAYVGTFSKSMLPSLRLGFAVLPDVVRRNFVTAKNALDWHLPTPMQRAVAAFITDGELSRHIRKMRTIYRQRRRRLADLMVVASPWLEPIPSTYGMHISALERQPGYAAALAEQGAMDGIALHTLDRYCIEANHSGVVLGFGVADDHAIAVLQRTILNTSR
ncbi:MAG: aminotransferase class I/II-fold pyridoxal phosphate-dependent enzyme [Sphingomonas sp.]